MRRSSKMSECACGCGGLTKGIWRRGHDVRAMHRGARTQQTAGWPSIETVDARGCRTLVVRCPDSTLTWSEQHDCPSGVFAAIEQVKHDYAIDPSRIYLFGSCSGGREALALAAKYPDRFVAVGLVSPEAEFNPVAPLRPTDPMAAVWLNQKTPLFNM